MQESSSGKLANEVALAVAALLGTDGPFRVRLFPAQAAGDVGWASVELMHAGAFRALAVVQEVLGTFPAVTMLRQDGKVVLRGHQRVEDGVAAAVAKWVGDGELDAGPVTALDLMCDVLPFVAGRVAVAGGWWRATVFGEWTTAQGSGVSFSVGGDEWDGICWFTQEPDGVSVCVAGRWAERWPVATRAELPAAFERLAGELSAALAARAAFRTRPLAIGVVGQRLLEALREAKVARPSWALQVREHFPGDSDANISRHDDLGQHFVALLSEAGGAAGGERRGIVHVSAGDVVRAIASDEELTAALPALVEGVRMARSRLSADQLRPGARYRVLRAFNGADVGRRLTFHAVTYYPKDGGTRYAFGDVELWDVHDADCKVLAALHEYLALDSQP